MTNIHNNLNNILHKIKKIANKDVKLIVVTKKQSIQDIEQAIEAGACEFAENYVQEALIKWQSLKIKYPHIKLHLIGHLQHNKVKKALGLFDVIQTLDSIPLVESIAVKLPVNHNISFFIQVNLDPKKTHGVTLDKLNNLVEHCKKLKLPIIGLMGILPHTLANNENYFQTLAKLNRKYNFPELSMGMSSDYVQAITWGATMVRLGKAVFNGEDK